MRSQLTIYLAGQTGIDANGKVAEGSRAQAVQGSELSRWWARVFYHIIPYLRRIFARCAGCRRALAAAKRMYNLQ
jgi:hypothetical protein